MEKGRNMIIAGFNFSNSNISVEDTAYLREPGSNFGKNYNVNVGYGRFIKDNVLLGASVNYVSNKSSSESHYTNGNYNISKYTSSGYTAGVLMRYYKPVYKNKLAFFAGTSLGYVNSTSHQRSRYGTNGVDISVTTMDAYNYGLKAGIYPGLVYFVNRFFSIETTFGNMGYVFTQSKNYRNGKLINTQNNGNFNSNINLSLTTLNLGVNFYFGNPAETKK